MAYLGPGSLIWQLPAQQAQMTGLAQAPLPPRLLLHALHALQPILALLVGCSLPGLLPQRLLLLSTLLCLLHQAFRALSLLNMLPCLPHALPSRQPAHQHPVSAFQDPVPLRGWLPQKSLSGGALRRPTPHFAAHCLCSHARQHPKHVLLLCLPLPSAHVLRCPLKSSQVQVLLQRSDLLQPGFSRPRVWRQRVAGETRKRPPAAASGCLRS